MWWDESILNRLAHEEDETPALKGRGTLVISCHQPVGSPSGIFEGITAPKGFVGFHERVAPVPGVNAIRILFLAKCGPPENRQHSRKAKKLPLSERS